MIRPDIQFLRGVAVLLVVFYHANFPLFKAGYLGVDVFFVLSGFLITGLIMKGIQAETFTFSGFYLRRAKRLLPAAYTTFFITLCLAFTTLTSSELWGFYDQLIGAVTFTGNMVLWSQGTYFGIESELKPLLHTWSLAVEEQYYLIVPAIMVLTPRIYWLRLVCFAFALSVIACFIFYYIQPAAAFYLFPARAWEMLLGSFGAVIYSNVNRDGWIKYLFWPSIIGILLLSTNPIGNVHPGIDALLICIFTLILILINFQKPFANVVAKMIVWIGDLSYSLYLIHWPLFAFLANFWISDDEISAWIRLLIIGVSIGLAFLQYKYVENRFRFLDNEKKSKKVMPLIIVSAVILCIPIGLKYFSSISTDSFLDNRRGNTGLGQHCTFDAKFENVGQCSTGRDSSVIVWGDSNAMHLVPGLVDVKMDDDILQATKYVCGPILNIGPVGKTTSSYQTVAWAKTCIDFNASVLDFLSTTPEVEYVILSSFFTQYLDQSNFYLFDGQETLSELTEKQQMEITLKEMLKTLTVLQNLGKKVVIVGPPPALNFDAGRCQERKQKAMIRFGRYSNCDMPYSDILALRAPVYKFLDDVRSLGEVEIIMFDDHLLEDGMITTSAEGVNIFIANAHLSYQGSKILAQKMDLMALAKGNAK